jgi:hypothetical protein
MHQWLLVTIAIVGVSAYPNLSGPHTPNTAGGRDGSRCSHRVAIAIDVSGSMAKLLLVNGTATTATTRTGNSTKTGTLRDELARVITKDLFGGNFNASFNGGGGGLGICVALYRFATRTELLVDYVHYAQPIADALAELKVEMAHPDYYTNWEGAITATCLHHPPAPDTTYFITDGMPSTREGCAPGNQPCDDYAANMEAAVSAAKTAHLSGVRVVPVAMGNDIPDKVLRAMCGACASGTCKAGVDFFRVDPKLGLEESGRFFNESGHDDGGEHHTDHDGGEHHTDPDGGEHHTDHDGGEHHTDPDGGEHHTDHDGNDNDDGSDHHHHTTAAVVVPPPPPVPQVPSDATADDTTSLTKTVPAETAPDTTTAVAATTTTTTTTTTLEMSSDTTTVDATTVAAQTEPAMVPTPPQGVTEPVSTAATDQNTETDTTTTTTTMMLSTTSAPSETTETPAQASTFFGIDTTAETTTADAPVTTAATTDVVTSTDDGATTTEAPTSFTPPADTTVPTATVPDETTTMATVHVTDGTSADTVLDTTAAATEVTVPATETVPTETTPDTTTTTTVTPTIETAGATTASTSPQVSHEAVALVITKPSGAFGAGTLGGHVRPGHDMVHPNGVSGTGNKKSTLRQQRHRHIRRRDSKLYAAADEYTDQRTVHGDNWVAIMIVGIVFAIFIAIVIIVLCVLSHRLPKAESMPEPTAPPSDEGTGQGGGGGGGGGGSGSAVSPVETRYTVVHTDSYTGASYPMALPIHAKFTQYGKLADVGDRTKSE